jgi:hypothetical protein
VEKVALPMRAASTVRECSAGSLVLPRAVKGAMLASARACAGLAGIPASGAREDLPSPLLLAADPVTLAVGGSALYRGAGAPALALWSPPL